MSEIGFVSMEVQPESSPSRQKKKRLGAHLGMKKSSPSPSPSPSPSLSSSPSKMEVDTPPRSLTKKRGEGSRGKRHKKSKSMEEKGKKEKEKEKEKKKKKRKKQRGQSTPKEREPMYEERKEEFEEEKGKGKEQEGRERIDDELTSSLSEFEFLSEEMESEGEDFIGNFEFHEEQPEKPFVCLQEDDIAAEQDREIQKIAELLSVSMPQAAGLLRFFKWNKDKLLTRFFDDPDGVLELAGVKVKAVPDSAGSDEMGIVMVENRCSICDEEAGEDLELFALDCKHYFCGLCWEQYLSMQIQEGQSGLIPCPSYDCGLLINENFVKQLVSEEIYAKYLLFLTKSFVDGNSQVRWCPAPGCGNAVNTDAPVGQTVHCTCGHSFCFRCGEEPHGPAHCEHVRDWNQKSQDESETNNWINANTQACPKCHAYTEKNGGCNHMTCRKCGHEYCWMCKKDWKGHYDFYTCNRFEKKSKKSKKSGSGKKKGKADKEMQAALEKEEHRQRLERYLHYYNQFMELDKMLGTVAKTREKINAKFQEWRDNDGTVAEGLFVEKALSVLATCWRALKWSSVRLYYFDDRNIRKNLFEFVRGDLEKSVNQLSEVLRDSPFEKTEVLDLTRLCETRLTNLLSWHNTCK